MKTSTLIAGASLAATALAAPLDKRQNIDTTILQFALTLEHLENAFYHGALGNFTAQDFANAGYGAQYYNNLKYIGVDEQVHVNTLTAALQAANVQPVAACTYSFPYTDVASFITLSSILEGVGTSAYLGGAPLISSKYYLTVAGSILATEAIHTSYQRAAIGEVPMANPFHTPVNPNPVFTLAAAFIVSCPPSNPPLPFKAFPSLTATGGSCVAEEPMKKRNWEDWSSSYSAPAYSSTPEAYSSAPSSAKPTMATYTAPAPAPYSSAPAPAPYQSPSAPAPYSSKPASPSPSACALPAKVACAAAPGSAYTFTAASAIPAGSFVTFASGLSVASVAGTIKGNTVTATIPSIAQGQTYVFITSKSETSAVPDSDILFGPAIVEVAPPPPVIAYSP